MNHRLRFLSFPIPVVPTIFLKSPRPRRSLEQEFVMAEPEKLPGMYHLVANSQLIPEHQIDGRFVGPLLEQPSSYSEPQLRSLLQPATVLFKSPAPGGPWMIQYVGHRSCQAIFGMNLASGRPEFGKGMNEFGYRILHRVLNQEALGGNKYYYFRLVGLELDWKPFVPPMFFLEPQAVDDAGLSGLTTLGLKDQAKVGEEGIGFVQKGHQRYAVWSEGAEKEVMKTL